MLIGDININSLQTSNDLQLFQNFLQHSFGLELIINQETTDYHSCLDHIYTNFLVNSYGVQECYWSDHKAV